MPDFAYEQEFGPGDHGSAAPDCSINWVRDGRLISVRWTASQDDFEVELRNSPGGGQTLVSSRPPRLIDIDQDGWPDLTVFTLIGMVNGDYDIFRYDPNADRFVPFGSINGASFTREEGGYLVAVGRSSAAASGVDVYRITEPGLLPVMSLYVDAGLPTGPDGTAKCTVSIDGATYDTPDAATIRGIFPDAPDLIMNYCNLYDEGDEHGLNLAAVPTAAGVVPNGTIFYCRLEGGTHTVTLTRQTLGLRYSYGPLDGTPELVLDRAIDEIDVVLPDAAEPLQTGRITFRNGAYAYTVDYGERLSGEPEGTLSGVNGRHGLRVVKDNNEARPVFQKDCLADTTYDGLSFRP